LTDTTSNDDDAPHTNPDAAEEKTPSAGWREVCHRLGVDPDATHPPADERGAP